MSPKPEVELRIWLKQSEEKSLLASILMTNLFITNVYFCTNKGLTIGILWFKR